MLRSLRARLILLTVGLVLASLLVLGAISSLAGKRELERIEEIRLLQPDGSVRRTFRRGRTPEAAASSRALDRTLAAGIAAVGLLAGVAGASFARRIVAPLEEVTRAAGELARGDLGRRVPVRSRDELGSLAGAFNGMAEALERQEEARRRFVADSAHELRTPLTNLRAQIEALQDGLLPPDADRLASLHEDVAVLSRIVEDLSDLARADTGRLTLVLEPVDVGEVVRNSVASHEPRAGALGIGLRADVSPALPPLCADRRRVAQVLGNLLENAIAHSAPGGRVVVEGRAGAPGFATLAVRDEGEGIPEEHRGRVFERFYRADPARSRQTGGSGLGLSIVRELALAQGGSVSLRSEEGRGTVVTVSLPFIENS